MTKSGESFDPNCADSVGSPRSQDTNIDPILLQGTSANLSRRYGQHSNYLVTDTNEINVISAVKKS